MQNYEITRTYPINPPKKPELMDAFFPGSVEVRWRVGAWGRGRTGVGAWAWARGACGRGRVVRGAWAEKGVRAVDSRGRTTPPALKNR